MHLLFHVHVGLALPLDYILLPRILCDIAALSGTPSNYASVHAYVCIYACVPHSVCAYACTVWGANTVLLPVSGSFSSVCRCVSFTIKVGLSLFNRPLYMCPLLGVNVCVRARVLACEWCVSGMCA